MAKGTSAPLTLEARPPRFDWYAATVRDDPDRITAALVKALDRSADAVETHDETTRPAAVVPTNGLVEVVKTRGLHGYEAGREFRRDGRTVATMIYGGANGWPHAWASGDTAHEFAEVVRSHWGPTFDERTGEVGTGHHVSRMDAAYDFDEPGIWDVLYGKTVEVASAGSVRLSTMGDWITEGSPDGRTLYCGSFKSPVLVRLYEKGKQLQAAAPPGTGASYSPDWVRLEVQVRPQKDARFRAAAATPQDAWGYARWTKKLAAEVLRLEVDRVHMYEDRVADDERALAYLVRQYGNVLGRLHERLGSWEAVGRALGERVDGEAEPPFIREEGRDTGVPFSTRDRSRHAAARAAMLEGALRRSS